jgi:undecaprenyl-diphosphatase
MAFVTILLALLINQAIGWVVFFPRPSMIGIGYTYLAHAADSTFPSDHATVLFAAAVAYRILYRHGSAAAFAIAAVIVGWARIYLGVHFPADILGAVVVAIAAGSATSLVTTRFVLPSLRFFEAVYRALFARLIERGWVRP